MTDWTNRIVAYGAEPPDQLLANPRNFRIHPRAQQEALGGALDTLGWVQDVLVNKTTGHVIDGHLRVALALRTGQTSVPVKYVELTEAEEAQALMSLDPIAAMAGTDKDKLEELLRAVNSDDERVQEYLAGLAKENGIDFGREEQDAEPQIDRAEELRVKWGVELGQLWQLGEHRLICGDCTDAAIVARVMGGEKADCVFTDPPYGVDYDPRFLAEIAKRHNKTLSSNNKVINDNGEIDLSFLFEYDRRMIWGFPYIYDGRATGWIVWDKQPGVESRGIVTPIEIASTTMRKGFDVVRCMWGGFYRASGEDRQPHPTQKPLKVYAPFIESWTKNGEVIYDPFSGSAPVLMVCENLHRKCRAIEISPGYVAVALQRWADATGKTPVLLDT